MATFTNLADLDEKESHNGESPRRLWEACDSPVYRVVNEEGNNVADARLRHLYGDYWLYVDDMDGYDILPESDVESFCLATAEEAG
jgi:hypothetical protein